MKAFQRIAAGLAACVLMGTAVPAAALPVSAENLISNSTFDNGTTDWGPYAQAGIGILLIGLALELAVEGYRTIIHQRKQAKLEKTAELSAGLDEMED